MHYTTSCNTHSSAPEDEQNNCPKHFELIGIINKPLLLHLVGCLYYLSHKFYFQTIYDDTGVNQHTLRVTTVYFAGGNISVGYYISFPLIVYKNLIQITLNGVWSNFVDNLILINGTVHNC